MTHVGLAPELAQIPPQLEKTEPADGVAVSVTDAPVANCELQTSPQTIAPGELATTPLPLPLLATLTVPTWASTGSGSNLTLTLTSPVTVKLQPVIGPPVWVQAPLQVLFDSRPILDTASRKTCVPFGNSAAQTGPGEG